MAGNAPPQNPTSAHVQSLLPKFTNQDPDIRYMSLNDLHQILLAGHPGFLAHDYTTCARVVEGFLNTLNDQNGDVQNMSVKCLGPFVNRVPDNILCPMIEKISNLKTDNTVDSSIPALAVRAIVVALPRPVAGTQRSQKVTEAYSAVSKAVIPRLVGYMVLPIANKNAPSPPKGMLQIEMETGQDTNSLDILTEVARCFGSMLQEAEVKALQKITIEVLENDRCGSVMKKKAVNALSILSHHFSDAVLSSFVSYTIEVLRQPTLVPSQKKLYLSIYSSMARTVPRKFGPYLQTLAPFVLAPLSQQELDDQRDAAADSDDEATHDPQVEEVREAALVSLDSFCAFCSQDMTSYAKEAVDTGLRFLRYDPNYADDDEDMDADDEEDEDMEADEDFEEETGFDDEDDVSWKVRRCSAKLLHTLVGSSVLANDEVLYSKIAPALITRFGEREESVRLEVLSTLASLIRKARESYQLPSDQSDASDMKAIPTSRKRRRDSSNAEFSQAQFRLASANGYTSPSTPPPQSLPQQSLATIGPEITRAAAKLLKSSTSQTKQSCISLLSTLIIAQRGGLSKSLDLIIEPIIDLLKVAPGAGGSSTAQQHALRIEVLRLLRAIADLHSSKVLQPFVAKIVPLLVSAVQHKYGKVAVEAIETIEVFIKALTPPRSAASLPQTGTYLKQVYDVLVQRITSADTDTEVRQHAILALGLLIGRTSGTKDSSMMSQDDRLTGQSIILERLRNELTRLSSVRAVETIAALAQHSEELKSEWVQQVSLELGAQLRKANRSLRGSSLSALRILAINENSRRAYDDKTTQQLVAFFLPVLADTDLHMLGPALTTLSAYANDEPNAVLSPDVVTALCKISKLDLQGSTLDALLGLVETFGKSGYGRDLMQALLKDVGISGNSEIVGQVIGTLLVSSSGDIGVTLDDFKTELAGTEDEKRKCLALYIIGEAGLRLGSTSPLKPEDFTQYFSGMSEKVQVAAAIALGRAGAGNVKAYLPVILDSMKSGGNYLLLHTVKEMLQHSTAEAEILAYSQDLWSMILTASKEEDNKSMGAECIGRLAIIDPVAYLPQLQSYLGDSEPAVRGMVIAAFRYTFTDTDTTYDVHLQPLIVQSLSTMLNEDNLENRRLGITTFNSAAHNKPQLITPHLAELLPLTMKETAVRPELIREVAMGPFKHKVDDGLELRKSAYETLYALMDTAFSSLPMGDFYERIVAGISDEHEIKILCCLVLTKLIAIAPAQTARQLERFAEVFRTVLAFKPKENAVKQELEKLQEHNKAILKVMTQMNKAFPSEASECRQWRDVVDWAKKEHPQASRLAEEELRDKDR
ncbi:Cullin-associated NEDD8-dissociated protein 1 [Sphaceloma murrayae]|uniref:Cullin-associated NEDD8-dissociated protein 1 n=1 Tax=Sphaceloma murrayae TaxID=2082308 RepID=A0A2K1QVE8_9PEZI|nr:Cullin-associated NEDD8-dissociated protein 1 [Sphaceloma murrayae]